MHNIAIIAAIGENNELGKDNQLLWHISDDLKRFKKITSGHTVIMGRKTFNSINNKPLPNRRNIVITTGIDFKYDQIEIVHSADEALRKLDINETAFIIGGASIYQLFLPVTKMLYLTMVHKSFNADVFFPDFPKNEWLEIERFDFIADQPSGLDYSYVTYQRNELFKNI
jgi:dihydrofolate reductase